MSEIINPRDSRATIRWKLLTGVSALALTAYISIAKADDSEHPTVWIELGGQFDSESDSAQTWLPPNVPAPIVQPTFEPFGTMPRIGYNVDGSISLQPSGSDWIYSASIQYGKAKRGPKSTHDEGAPTGHNLFGLPAPATYAFTDSHAVSDATHLVLDFQAGKDLGLGLFGGHGSSNIKFGVRVAHFAQNADGIMTAQVSAQRKYQAGIDRAASMHAARSFSGIGPSIDWNASLPLTGSQGDGFAFDWGANASVLFGRQKADVRLHTSEIQYTLAIRGTAPPNSYLLTHATSVSIRKKQVVVPSLGGFAAVSYRLNGDAKLSFGYRADVFFNAIDGGIASRKTENRGFFGPFASLSVGVGD